MSTNLLPLVTLLPTPTVVLPNQNCLEAVLGIFRRRCKRTEALRPRPPPCPPQSPVLEADLLQRQASGDCLLPNQHRTNLLLTSSMCTAQTLGRSNGITGCAVLAVLPLPLLLLLLLPLLAPPAPPPPPPSPPPAALFMRSFPGSCVVSLMLNLSPCTRRERPEDGDDNWERARCKAYAVRRPALRSHNAFCVKGMLRAPESQ